MKYLLVFLSLTVVCLSVPYLCHAQEDNDFAEFEDFDTEEFESEIASDNTPQQQQQQQKQQNDDFAELEVGDDDEDGVVEDEENEFEHFQDEEEFEGFSNGPGDLPADTPASSSDPKKTEPKLIMAKVPMNFRTHWDSYWMEMIMLAGLLAYFTNYFVGRNKNSKLANLWLATHRSLLEENFALIGDDSSKKDSDSPAGFMKESESLYTLWCSGRTCCEGMLVELKMIKRQDLVAILSGMMRPTLDQLQIKVEISKDIMDPFVFLVGAKKTASRLFKELSDLSKFCMLVSKPEEKYNIPAGFSVLSEIVEATSSILDSRLIAALNKYNNLIDFIHITDQFSGPIQQEDASQLKQPEVRRLLICCFNIPKNADMEEMKPLLILVLYLLERLKRLRLSKEGKSKADRNRLRVEEEFLKTTHVARAEAAAQRREDKRKQEKEKILADDDPEKQRRWEKKEQKRQAKKQQPKMKQLSIKAL